MTKLADLHRGSGLAFLFSMPRSGSTAFSMMLGTHSAILSPPEPWILLSLADLLGIGDLRRIPYGEESVLLATAKYLNRIAAADQAVWLGASIGKSARARLAGAAPEVVLRDLASELYAKNLSLCGKRLFLDKTPRYYRILPLLDKIFPLARKIFLVRNPMDVASSYKSTWNISIDKIAGHDLRPISYDFCHGLFQLERYFSRRSATKLIISYEALVRDPGRVLAQTCGFLGVRFEPKMLLYYRNASLLREHRGAVVGDPRATTNPRPLDAASIDQWRTTLSMEEKAKLVAALGPEIFVRLGYAKVPAQLNADGISFPTSNAAEAHRKAVVKQLAADGTKAGRAELGALDRMANGLLMERNSLTGKIARLVADLSTADSDRQRLRTTSEHEIAEKLSLAQDRNAKAEAIGRLSAELAAADVYRGRLRQAGEILAAEKAALEREREADSETIRRLTAEIAALDRDRQGLRQANRSLTAEKLALEQERAAGSETLMRLTADIAALDEARQGLRQANRSLTAEKLAAEQERAAGSETLMRLTADIAALDEARQGLRQATKRLTTEKSALEQDRNAKGEVIVRLTAELTAMDANLRNTRHTNERLAAEKAALDANRKALLEANQRLTKELSALEQDRETKSATIGQMTSELSALRASGAAVRQHVEALKDELRKLNVEAQALWAEGTLLQQTSVASQKATTEARAEAAAAREALASQEKSYAQEVKTLAAALEELRQQTDHASARIKALTQSLADAQRTEKDLRSLNGSLNDQLQSAVNQIKSLTTWVHEARDEAQRLQAAYDKTIARGVVKIARRLRRPWDRSFGKHEK